MDAVRTPRIRTLVATLSALVLGCTGGLVALAPAAHAGTVTPTVHCVLPAGQGEATGPQEMTVELTPDTAEAGAQVHATVTLGASPAIPGTTLNDVPTTPSIDLAMSGGATGTVTVRGPQIIMDIVAGQPLVMPVYEGDFFLPANAAGPVDFTPVRTQTQTVVFGTTFSTPCDVVGGGGVVDTVTAQDPSTLPATLTAPTSPVKPNTAVTLSGTRWTPGGTPAAALCLADGSSCDPAKVKATALAIDASGNLSGTVTLQEATRVPDGSYLIRVNDGTKEATAALGVAQFVPAGPRTIALSPASGPVGTVVRVTGSDYFQDRWIIAEGLDAAGVVLGTGVFVKSTPDGTFALDYTVASDAVAAIRVKESNNADTAVIAPFTVTVPTVSTGAGTVKPGRSVALSGTGWPAGVTPTATLCLSDGSGCDASRISASALSTDASGMLSGTVTIASGTAKGGYELRVTSGTLSASTPLTVSQK
ncbi:hypothetical protein AB0M28_17910 [Streptomyces sp. NPDC051940]|uniref:hypothetical protein n=1 Tax=Streptomyces sp. NPDC051940 TaxID=3155675 RepID=UPI003426E292